ncbi:MAG: carboxylesterase family protein [Parvularculaceae bacterium]|nr:carboxylesterase family protein [Parvularculaceae bacterium]
MLRAHLGLCAAIGHKAASALLRFFMIRAVLILAFALLAACGRTPAPSAPPVADPATLRTVAQGDTIGFSAPAGVQIWRGLPFAAPPVGDLRWRAPRPAANWTGVREALEGAGVCPQIANVFNAVEGVKPGILLGTEDCLYLDIYAPKDAAATARLPVMVWIHGGGNVWGSAKQYDPSNLARNENVIVVVVQYRLGPLGWFAHEAIRQSAETPDDGAASFAILDLVASLEWVKENIAAFGGDPSRVTIFGESAGGANVAGLLASPRATGLFHRAIVQSGLFDSTALGEAENGGGADINPAAAVAARLGATDAAGLRAVSAETLFKAYELDAAGFSSMPRMIADGVALPSQGLREALRSPATFNAVPVITGTNRDEMKLFQLVDPRFVNRYLGVILIAKDQQFYDRLADYQSRLWRIRSVDEPAALMTEGGHREVYAYRFDWDEGGRFLLTDLKALLGAAHGLEIPFVMNKFALLGRLDPVMWTKATLEERETLSRQIGGYWAALARDGDPNGAPRAGARPEWRPWSAEGALMRLDGASDGGVRMIAGLDSVDRLIADLEGEQALTREQKRLIAEALGLWLPSRKADFLAAAG